MAPISLAIITYNEQDNLSRCIESVLPLGVSEIIIVDSGSTDNTAEIAKKYGAKFSYHPWNGYVEQKNYAFSLCSQPWILSLDADECLSPELAEGIITLFSNDTITDSGFYLNRRNWYLGAWIWHAWYPEWRLRLVRKEVAQWTGNQIHEKLEVIGSTKKIHTGDLLHFSFVDLHDHLTRTIKYARIAADAEINLNVNQFRWRKFLFSPPARFFKSLLINQSFRDGWRGYLIAFIDMIGAFCKYSFILEHTILEKKEKSHQ